MTSPRRFEGVGRVLAVGRNTYREAVRNRAFLGLLVFAVAFILFSLVVSELTVVGQGPRVVQNFGFFATIVGLGGDGLVPISTIGDEYFHFDEAAKALVGAVFQVLAHVLDRQPDHAAGEHAHADDAIA